MLAGPFGWQVGEAGNSGETVGGEAIEGIEENMQALANDVHWRGASADGLPINRYVIRAGCEALGQSHASLRTSFAGFLPASDPACV